MGMGFENCKVGFGKKIEPGNVNWYLPSGLSFLIRKCCLFWSRKNHLVALWLNQWLGYPVMSLKHNQKNYKILYSDASEQFYIPSERPYYYSQLPPHFMHRAVHAELAFVHFYSPLNAVLEPQWIRSLQMSFAWRRVVQCGDQILLSCCHSHSAGFRVTGSWSKVCPHTCPAWKTALLTCCSSAACVGGIPSRLFLE